MRSPRTAVKSSPCSLQLKRKPTHSNEDPTQPKINNNKKRNVFPIKYKKNNNKERESLSFLPSQPGKCYQAPPLTHWTGQLHHPSAPASQTLCPPPRVTPPPPSPLNRSQTTHTRSVNAYPPAVQLEWEPPGRARGRPRLRSGWCPPRPPQASTAGDPPHGRLRPKPQDGAKADGHGWGQQERTEGRPQTPRALPSGTSPAQHRCLLMIAESGCTRTRAPGCGDGEFCVPSRGTRCWDKEAPSGWAGGQGHPARSWPGRPPAPCPEARSSLLGHGRGPLVRKAGVWGEQGRPH